VFSKQICEVHPSAAAVQIPTLSLSISKIASSDNTINIMILAFNDINLNIKKIPFIYIKL
jgi:hypothetical protein